MKGAHGQITTCQCRMLLTEMENRRTQAQAAGLSRRQAQQSEGPSTPSKFAAFVCRGRTHGWSLHHHRFQTPGGGGRRKQQQQKQTEWAADDLLRACVSV